MTVIWTSEGLPFNPLCESGTYIRNRDEIPNPIGLNCKPCLTPIEAVLYPDCCAPDFPDVPFIYATIIDGYAALLAVDSTLPESFAIPAFSITLQCNGWVYSTVGGTNISMGCAATPQFSIGIIQGSIGVHFYNTLFVPHVGGDAVVVPKSVGTGPTSVALQFSGY